jgi:hypothetical protein
VLHSSPSSLTVNRYCVVLIENLVGGSQLTRFSGF